MLTLLLILIIIACILLVLIILAQNPKGGGLSGTFGAGASQFLGARQTADFLEKATWYFGIGILIVVTATYFLTVSPTGEATQKSKVSNASDDFITAPVSPGGSPATSPLKPNAPTTPGQDGTTPQGEPTTTPPPAN